MSEQPHFAVLGPLEVTRAGQPVRLGSTRLRTLLATLLLRANRPVSITDLADRLWNDQPPGQARRTIQVYVVRLRQALGDADLISTDSTGYLIRVDAHHLDLSSFDNLVRDAARTTEVAKRAKLLTKALALWRGPACADVVSDVLQAHEVPPLHERRLDAEEQLIDAELALGRHAEHLPRLRELVTEHPLRERFAGQLMLALYRSGRQADALDVYRTTAATLADELGLDPGPELQRLHQAVLTADPQLLARPQAAVPAQLPADSARFTGRSAELDELLEVPGGQAPTTVVISAIDGMAGVGKTALAVHAAHRLAPDYPDGQLFIDLHGYTAGVPPVEPANALDRMLRAIGIPGTEIPVGLEDRAALYRSTLSGRRMLIVLDNANSHDQVQPLLPGQSGCLVLITSRQRLAGLDSIRQISLDVLPPAEAAALFTRIIEPTPPVDAEVAEIVELCGRLPLAIRIAGARLRSRPSWSLVHLADRLRNQRMDSVAAAFELSYQQLALDQQRVFRILGLHPGPDIDTYAAAALAGTTLDASTRLFDDLVDSHLLQEPAPGRYQFHDLVRAYASSLDIPADERAAALSRLLDHYAHTATTATDLVYPEDVDQRPRPPATSTPVPAFDDAGQAEAWLDTELANLLAAAGHGRPDHTIHLSATLLRHLRHRSQHSAAAGLHQQTLTAARATGNRLGELTALLGLGDVHRHLGRNDLSTEDFQQALEIGRAVGEPSGELAALVGLGQSQGRQGRLEPAAAAYTSALEVARAIGNRAVQHDALNGLGHIHQLMGRYPRAADAHSEALKVARNTGNRTAQQDALIGLAFVHHLQGHYAQAADDFEQALEIARTTRHQRGEQVVLTGLADAYLQLGRHEPAADAYRAALDLARTTGDPNYQFEALHGLGNTDNATGRHDQALAHHQQAFEIVGGLGQPADQARAHDGLARTYQALGDREQAHHHWQTALHTLISHAIDHTDDPQVTTATIRARLADLDQDCQDPGRYPG